MTKQFVNSQSFKRDKTVFRSSESVQVKTRENINGTIYIRDKEIPIKEHLSNVVPARTFKLSSLINAGVPLEDINTSSFLDTKCTEHKVQDKDISLQLLANDLENHLESIENTDTDNENNDNN